MTTLHEVLIFSDGENRLFKPDDFHSNNFVLQLLGLKQYNSEIKLLETPVYRDLQNNIIYFRDMLPVSSTQWDIYMNAVRFGDIRQEDLAEKMNISRATLINYEKGHTTINLDVLKFTAVNATTEGS